MKKIITSIIALAFSTLGFAQLPNGSTAPNFTLTDIDGTTHDLYTYLDAGKTVYLDFFAAHCPFCWNYKNSGAVNDLNAQYGINGSINQDIVILAIELDQNNGLPQFNGTGSYTQGDWISALSYPIINPEGADYGTIVNNFEANYYPLIYGICPNKEITVVGTQNTAGLYSFHTGTCKTASVGEIKLVETPFVLNQENKTITLKDDFDAIQLVDLTGKIVATFQTDLKENSSFTINTTTNGLFILQLSKGAQTSNFKIQF